MVYKCGFGDPVQIRSYPMSEQECKATYHAFMSQRREIGLGLSTDFRGVSQVSG
jgi:hypothetical protein